MDTEEAVRRWLHYDRELKRVWVHYRLRVHHGLVGALCIAWGALLVWHDWHDRWWFHD